MAWEQKHVKSLHKRLTEVYRNYPIKEKHKMKGENGVDVN